ncbi:MAG: hypothetical protein CMD88_02990 [Gammaproteobacteria bacterium]|nr:hypothetical protein [Gammaproteobacteria bacterium]|tara:strand:- start:83577 stop:84074 length:498 start_codon:yes stop_codon:yes gene_type:complete
MLEKDYKIPELDKWLKENPDQIKSAKKEKKDLIELEENFEPASFDIENLEYTEIDDQFSYKSNGIQTKILEKLKKNKKNEFDCVEDLHGLTKRQAKTKLDNVIKEAIRRKYKKIKIIFGKGHHSPGMSELIKVVTSYCIKSKHIKVACSAKKNDGGIGVIYIQLV